MHDEKLLPLVLFTLLLILISPLEQSSARPSCSEKSYGYLCKYWNDCGKSNAKMARTKGYIANGTQVGDGEFPFVAQIMIPDMKMHCLGAIVSDYHIVTANSCFGPDDFHLNKVMVRVGSTESMLRDAVVHGSIKDFIEGDCVCPNPDLKLGDLAVLSLKKRLEFDSNVQPACLTDEKYLETDGDNSMCYQIGAGFTANQTEERLPVSKQLQKFRAETYPCESVPRKVYNETITWDMVCMRSIPKGSAPCYGDLGGPILCHKHEEDRWYLYAALSPYPKETRCLANHVYMASVPDSQLAMTTLGDCSPPIPGRPPLKTRCKANTFQ